MSDDNDNSGCGGCLAILVVLIFCRVFGII